MFLTFDLLPRRLPRPLRCALGFGSLASRNDTIANWYHYLAQFLERSKYLPIQDIFQVLYSHRDIRLEKGFFLYPGQETKGPQHLQGPLQGYVPEMMPEVFFINLLLDFHLAKICLKQCLFHIIRQVNVGIKE